MSGELQTIPARHGVATFVPRGRTIKIINTYGKQVVSTWAFGLGAPPEEGDNDEDEEEIEEKVDELKEELRKSQEEGKEDTKAGTSDEDKIKQAKEGPNKVESDNSGESKQENQPGEKPGNAEERPKKDADDPPEEAPETTENTSEAQRSTDKKSGKRTWSSYIPSIPYRSKNQNQTPSKADAQTKQDDKAEQAQNEATSKKWSSYLPTGKGFSSYVPNLQMPDTQGVVSAFKSSNSWDPNKSYAEQLYDFSKTPVGAGTIAAASGSGTASSIYAAYNAYTKLSPSKNDLPPMEYLSLPHTRAATNRLVPEINDTLLTNLRNPLMTLIEDNSTGAHDTLTAACDANMYAALGVDKPAEHGSCAENLVLALRELNEKAGLRGTKAVGADITVNIAPTPLHLFMNAPLQLDNNVQSDGSGAKGATLKVEEPRSKKRSYVRFRAERDMVIVLSACPNDVGPQNGGRCMAANFMVEEPEEGLSASTSWVKDQKSAPKKSNAANKGTDQNKQDIQAEDKPRGIPELRGGPQKAAAVKKSAEMAGKDEGDDAQESESSNEQQKETDTKPGPSKQDKEEEVAEEKPRGMPGLRGGPQKAAAVKKSAEMARNNDIDDPPESELPDEQQKKTNAEETNDVESKSDASKLEEPKAEEAQSAEAPKPKKKPKKLERRSAASKSETS